MSSGKKTKHIKAKFFFIKDRVDDGEIKVIDCPTEEMWADIMMKPLQGMAFRTMRAELMNCPVNYEEPEENVEENNFPISAAKTVTWKSDVQTTFKTPQECVGQNGNRKGKPVMDRRLRNSYHKSKVTRGTVGKARLVSTGGPVGVSGGIQPKQ
jgi:hypothetical protein